MFDSLEQLARLLGRLTRHQMAKGTQCLRPHVALLVETSLGSGRDILRGIKYQEYLGAVFKAHLGKTPAQFRRENRGAASV